MPARSPARRLQVVGLISGGMLAIGGLGLTAAASVDVHHSASGIGQICYNPSNGDIIRLVLNTTGQCPRGSREIDVNTRGLPGFPGPSGAPGTLGVNGARGSAGGNGASGSAGPSGPPGITGPSGPAGSDGPSGPAGPSGAPGPNSVVGQVIDYDSLSNGTGQQTVIANCPSGQPFVNGSANVIPDGDNTSVVTRPKVGATDSPTNGAQPDGWLGQATLTSNQTLVVHVLCDSPSPSAALVPIGIR